MPEDRTDPDLKDRLDNARRWGTYLIILFMVLAADPAGTALTGESAGSWEWFWAGVVVTGSGILLRTLAAGTIVKDDELSTTGVYALCRNPLYLGSLLIYTGFVLMSGWWFFLIPLWGWFAWIYHRTISYEEDKLAGRYPEQFAEFTEEVPRFLPRPGSFVKMLGEGGSFSWRLYLNNREYEGGILATLTALLIGLVRPGAALGVAGLLPEFLHLA